MNPDRFQAALELVIKADEVASELQIFDKMGLPRPDGALEKFNSECFDLFCISIGSIDAILEALSLAASGQVLPMLPDGWDYAHIAYSSGEWVVQIAEPGHWITERGPTPYAAAQKAIEGIGK